MKFLISVILTALTAFVVSLYLPWWGIALAAFAVALVVPQRPWVSWLAGFLGLFLLWVIVAWWIDSKNAGILSAKMAALLSLGTSSFLLILVTGLVGALVGGMAALTGSFVRKRE